MNRYIQTPSNDTNWDNVNDFVKQKFSWINIELIDAILKSLQSPQGKNSTLSFLEFIDTIRFRKFKNENRKIPYPRLRDIADFLAFPPWYFFKAMNIDQINDEYNTTNRPVEEMYKRAVSNLPELEVVSTWGIINLLMKRNLKSDDIIYLEGLQSTVDRYEVGEDWITVTKELKEMKEDDFRGAATINIGNKQGLYDSGTLRFCRGYGEIHNKKHILKWSSAWFAVDIVENDNVAIDNINYIVDDVSRIIGKIPWKYEINMNKKTRYLFSWHSLRNMDIEIFDKSKSKVNEILERTLPIALNQIYCINLRGNHKITQELIFKNKRLLSWLALDIKNKNTIDFLLEVGYIKEHDTLVFKNNDILFDNNHAIKKNESFFKGSIVLHHDKPYIKWAYDEQIYSISKLTHILKQQLTGQDIYQNGNKYWSKLGERQSLYYIREYIVGKI
jgi:hypothetical protein